MTANDRKTNLSYLNKLVDQYNNTYYHSIGRKPINAGYSAVTEKIETNGIAPKLELPTIRTFLVKVTLKNGQEKYLLSIPC